MGVNIPKAALAGLAIVLLTAPVPVPAAADVCDLAPVEFSGAEDLLWLGEILPLYLEYYCRAADLPPAAGRSAVRIEAVVRVEQGKASADLTFSFPDGRSSGISLGGEPAQAAAWLAPLGDVLLREGVIPSGSALPAAPPTVDMEALRQFGTALAAEEGPARQTSLARAVERDGDFDEARWLLAIGDYERSDCAGALEGFGAVASGRPGLPAPLMNEALCLLRVGRAEEGAGRLQKAAAMRPDSLEVALFRGTALAAAGRFEEAEEVFAALLKRDPRLEEALFPRALLAARLKGTGSARAGVADLDTNGRRRGRDYFHRSGQRAFGSGDLPGARTAFELAIIADPGHSPSRLALAVVKYALGEYEEAVDDLSSVSRDFGGDPDVYRYLGLSYEKLGNTEAAMDSFRRSAEFLAQQGGGDTAKSLFVESLAESREADSFPPAVPALYLEPLAGFWKGEGVVLLPVAPVAPVAAAAGGALASEPPAGSPPPAPEPAGAGAGEEAASLTELLRVKEDQAVRLAQEALAAQKALREARGEKERLAAELEKVRQGSERLEETVLNRDEALLSLEVTLNEYRNQVNELQSAAAGGEELEVRIGEQAQTIAALRTEIASLQDGLRKGAAEGGKALDDRVAELEGEKRKLADLLDGFRSDAAAWEKRERDLKEEQRALQGRLSSLEREIGGLEQKLESGRRSAREAEKAGEEKAGLAAKMEEKARRSDEDREELEKSLAGAREQIDRLEDELRQAGKAVAKAEKELSRSREAREEAEEKLGRSRKTGEGLQEKVIELEEALSAVEKREADALRRLTKNEKKLAAASGKRDGLDGKLRETEDAVAALRKTEAGLRKELKALRKELARETKRKNSLERELDEAGGELARLRKDAGESNGLQKEAASLGRELAGLREELEEKEGELAGLRTRFAEASAGADRAVALEGEVKDLAGRLERQGLRLEELGADNARLKSLAGRMAKKLRDSATMKHGGGSP